ncbi:hypothetical protein [Kutzneria chonburiensis]|uniref:Uncharacterized protein n=1 Tax=Kutzneria chonburiensis TaxID=1483604 RepID=A0ABV6MK40_9PSEU|nr:hypothetical protein [Kutzneria chonburiensis]
MTTTDPAGWIRVTAQHGLDLLNLPAEPTSTAGLLITPDWRDSRWTGLYAVVHAASGQVLPYTDLPLVYTREVADQLGRHGIDWTEPTARPTRPSPGSLRNITAAAADAWQRGIPLWWARPSWQACPPLWRLNGIDVADGEDGWISDLDYGPAWTTWRGVVGWLDLTHDDPFTEPLIGTITVSRDQVLSWRLVCAAPLCHDDQPAVAGWFDAEGDFVERPTTDREFLAVTSTELGWRQHGRHWLCPTCAHDHTPNYDRSWW